MISNAVERAHKLEMLLMTVRFKSRHTYQVSNTEVLLLNDADSLWLIYNGSANVFWVPVEDGAVAGTRHFLFHSLGGTLFFGMVAQEFGCSLEIVGTPSAQIIEIPREHFAVFATDPEYADVIADLVDEWVQVVAKSLFQESLSRHYEQIKMPGSQLIEEKQAVTVKSGVMWATRTGDEDWPIQFNDRADLDAVRGLWYLPLTAATWIRALDRVTLQIFTTYELMSRPGQQDLWIALTNFHYLALLTIHMAHEKQIAFQQQLLYERQAINQQRFGTALRELASPLAAISGSGMEAISTPTDRLIAACQVVAQAMGIELKMPSEVLEGKPTTLQRIANFSRFRIRKVALRGEWWRENNGSLLAYLAEDKSPVALLRTPNRRYALYNPATGSTSHVMPAVAEKLHPLAHVFYRTLPDRAINAADLLIFGAHGIRREITNILAFSLIVGLLSLLPPVAIGHIVDQIIPGAQHVSLFIILLALLLASFSTAGFEILRGIALLQAETWMDLSVQTGLMDRVLELPVSFFRKYSSGDLVVRLLSINSIRQTLSGVVINTLLSGVFSLFSLLLLFFFSVPLAIVALILSAILLGSILLITRKQVQYERQLATQQGFISGMLHGFLNGVAKFRVAGAEMRVFGQWASEYSKLRQMAYQSRLWSGIQTVFGTMFPIITTMVLFIFVSNLNRGTFSTGSFVAFNAAFMQFLASVLSLSSTYIAVARLIPLYERARPILETVPEVDPTKVDPGELKGEIDVQQVSFRYGDNLPLVLQDISISIARGEFVAFVGPSGSGKSSMLRLLMGFDQPLSGNIYYDGQDFSTLDVRLVRQQIGVVLQNGRLLEGDIFTNIVGASNLKMNDAWTAAQMAGISEDISEMPMGMYTVVSGGGITLSGGQRQRILIARALIHKPRLLFFDEATSALDNRTQEIVSKSMLQLNATKVIIAHRLNTILKADQIYVFDKGRIVQQGTYTSLMRARGLFQELARRQTL